MIGNEFRMMLLRKWIKVLFFVCWGVAWWYRDLIGAGFFWCAVVLTGLVVMLNWQDAYSLCPERKWRGDPNLFLLAATAPWWGLLNPMHEVGGWRWWLWACVSPLWLLLWAMVGMWMRRWMQVVLPALVLLGFGRVRFRCGLNWQFEYDGGLCAIAPDGRSRRFSLVCCANRYALLEHLGAAECAGQIWEDWQKWWREWAKNQPQRYKKFRVAVFAEMAFFVLPAWPRLSRDSISIRLLPTAWYASVALTALWLLPLAWWGRGLLAGNRRFRLPENHIWRRFAIGRIAAALLFAGKFALFWLVMGTIFAWPVALVGGWLSLQWQPYRVVSAGLEKTGETCAYGRYGPRVPRIRVRLPEEYAAFDGKWCSRLLDDVYLLENGSQVYLRESVFARELLFRRP